MNDPALSNKRAPNESFTAYRDRLMKLTYGIKYFLKTGLLIWNSTARGQYVVAIHGKLKSHYKKGERYAEEEGSSEKRTTEASE